MRNNKGYRKLVIGIFIVAVAFLYFLNGLYQGEKQLVYYPSGELKQEYFTRNGEANGLLTEYFKTGEVSSIVRIQNGKQDGWAQFFYMNGQLRRKTFFKDGIQEDTLTSYYKDGSLETASSIKNGEKNGRFLTYYNNGKLKAEGFYTHNRLEGEAKLYNLRGGLMERSFYNRGDVFAVIREGEKEFEFINVRGNFKLTLPNTFVLDTLSESSLAIFRNKQEDLSLMVGANTSTLPIEDEVNNQISKAERENDIKITSSKAIELEGLEGLLKGVENRDSNEYAQFCFIKANGSLINIYLFMPTTAKGKYADKLEKILESFSLLNS